MPVVDPNNWVPQYDAREDQETITPITQADGSVRYFQGNYDEVGEIDRVIIEELVSMLQVSPQSASCGRERR